MAALAEASEVAEPVVARVMIEMRRGQNDARRPHLDGLLEVWPARHPAPGIAPSPTLRVEPAAVRKSPHSLPVGPPAGLAGATGALEAHPPA